MIPDAFAPVCDGDPDDVAPEIPCRDALEIPAPVIPVPVIPGDADPRSGWHLRMSVGIFNHPVFLLRDPKRDSLGAGEVYTRGRWGSPRCSCCERFVEGILDSWIGYFACDFLYIRCGPSCSRMCIPGRNRRCNSCQDTPTSCGSAPAFDDDSLISGDDDASAVVDNFSSSRRSLS